MNQIPTIDDYLMISAHPLRKVGGCCKVDKWQCDSAHPLVTIFTAVKNRKDTLPQTIMSVLSQSYPNIEYIVIDGASTDGTLDVLRQFDNKIDSWISEPDYGTSDAFNKAISMAKGDFIFWLSSDDWINPDFIETAVQSLLMSGAEFVFGDMAMYDNDKAVAMCKGDKDYMKSMMSGNPHFNYPSMVIKKECFQKLGLIDTTYRIINDYEWTIRLHMNGGRGFYSSSLLVHRRVGGVGESHPLQNILEYIRLSKQYRLPRARAIATHLYYMVRMGIGYVAKLFLPNVLRKKLKSIMHRSCSVPMS